MVWLSVAIAARTDLPYSSNVIRNTVCIESPQLSGKKCDDADITIVDNQYACLSITWTNTVVPSNGNITFTCRASDATKQHSFKIDCGNGYTKEWAWTSSFTYTCHYNDDTTPYEVACYVDDKYPTNPACETTIGYGIYWECGNGIIEPGEDCDLKWGYGDSILINNYLDFYKTIQAWQYANNWYYCRNCKLIKEGNFVYDPAECFSTDKPISVMNNEIIPFWWKLNVGVTTNNITVTNDRSYCEGRPEDKGTLIYPTDCNFAVYNWTHKQGDNIVQSFKLPCYNDNYSKYNIYKYFDKTHDTPADWASVSTVNAYTDGNHDKELWEYKIVLETVEYDVCDPEKDERISWKRSGPVCEVNAAITRPYAMQISTFGAAPVGVSENKKFLYDFYDMQWNQLLDKTDLGKIMNIESASYSDEENVQDEINKFKDKYGKLAVKVDGSTTINKGTTNSTSLNSLFKDVDTIKKVPNQNIYFLEWNGTLKLSQDYIKKIWSAYTIFVDWMDVEIEWNVLQYAMVITTEQMSFKDGWPEGSDKNIMRCADWWQVVQWLYIAWEWFKTADEDLRNTDPNELWCPWWWLHVKWALIWDGIKNIVDWKRSQLNSWFNIYTSNPQRERREKIIWWAAVLIEYSPSLWKTLPPGAEVFSESLEVYRK